MKIEDQSSPLTDGNRRPRMRVPMLDLSREYRYMKGQIDSAIETCLAHQTWVLGPEVTALEEKLSEYLKVKHCVAVASGTDALVLALRALAINLKGQEYFTHDDLIITTPFTFTATGDAILRAGATPVFLDIDPGTFNIDVSKLREFLSDPSRLTPGSSRVVGIIPVHLYGRPCDMDEIMRLAREHNLFVLEDTAQAFGGKWEEQSLGCIGSAGAYSFFPSKNLGGFGDGGMVSTDGNEIASLVRMLLKHGGKDKYNVEHIGYNARLDTLQAAVLLAKLEFIDEFNEARRHIALTYSERLADLAGIVLPVDSYPCQAVPGLSSSPVIPAGHVFHQYTIRVKGGRRDDLQKFLQTRRVASMVYYPVPLHKMKVFGEGRSISPSVLPHAEAACAEVLSLPMEPLMTEEEIIYVCEQVREFFR